MIHASRFAFRFAIAASMLALAPLLFSQGGIHVIDGDTVALGSGGARVRLINFDTAETGSRAQCPAERIKGNAAKRRLKELLATNDHVELTLVPCGCRPGTEGTLRCNHARSCGILTIAGRDVADVMIGEELARPYLCGKTQCQRRESWC